MNFIVDRTMPDNMVNNLLKYGTVYKSFFIDLEDVAVSTHPDMQIHFIDHNLAVCVKEAYDYYREILPKNINLLSGSKTLGRTYPNNCAYNIAKVGENIICNTKYADKSILAIYRQKNYKIIHVNQGYTKCNICPISDNVVLTEDKGIHKVLANEKSIKSILLHTGGVSLEGFDCGFIGGASGICGATVIFCGKINNEIKSILQEENVKFIQLSDKKLYDYGSILSFE